MSVLFKSNTAECSQMHRGACIVTTSAKEAMLHSTLSLAAQCIVIGPVCVFATDGRRVFVGLLPR